MPTNTYGNPGATNPKDLYVAGRTSVPSAGGFQGYNITPGTDAEIAAQVQAISARGAGYPSLTGDTPTPPDTGGTPSPTPTPTPTAPDLDTAYSNAMSKYLESLTASNEAQTTSDKASVAARRGYENLLSESGGLKSGAEQSAAYFNRRATSNLADLGIAQDAATRASNVFLERLKYEQDLLGKPKEDFNLSPGQTRYAYDPTTGAYKEVASAAANEPAGPASVQEYEYAKKNGYTGTFAQYQNEDANRKAKAAGGTATERSAAQRADINAAINDFQTQMSQRGWAGANPNAYKRYKQYLLSEYGLSAVNELDNAMQSFGIVVDTKNT